MGIKDNFSQAVKELWKKDGKDGQNDRAETSKSQPSASELDRYLRDENGMQGNAVLSEDAFNNGGRPLETPYYRTAANTIADNLAPDSAQNIQAPQAPGQGQPAQGQQAQAQQPTRTPDMNANAAQERGGEQPPINQNVANARRASGQDMPNAAEDIGSGSDQGGFNDPNMGSPNQGGYNNPNGGGYDQGYNNYNNQNSYGNFGGQSYGGGQGGYNGGQGGYNGGQGGYNGGQGGYNGGQGGYGGYDGGWGGYGGNPPAGGPNQRRGEVEELTVISPSTIFEGNIRTFANVQIDGKIKGNVETTKNLEMGGVIIGDIIGNNAGMTSALMQGNISLKGRLKMDQQTTLKGDLSCQYADINGKIQGKVDTAGKAELKRDAVVVGDITASTIAVTDGAIIYGFVSTTFLPREESQSIFPDDISIESTEIKS